MIYKTEIAEALPTISCACCGVAFQAASNQMSTEKPICGAPTCSRWQSRERNEKYRTPKKLAEIAAVTRARYAANLEASRRRGRARAAAYFRNPVTRAAYNLRRKTWRQKRRAAGLSAP
jgi:hypothetical protein